MRGGACVVVVLVLAACSSRGAVVFDGAVLDATTAVDAGAGVDGGTAADGGADGEVCAAGLTDCDGECVDTNVDPGNCGACGCACGPGAVCNYASCLGGCPSGMTSCPGDGPPPPNCPAPFPVCVDTNTNPDNCGACGNKCGGYWCNGTYHGYPCTIGMCPECPTSQITCLGVCVDPQSDDSNCGACCIVCPVGQSCVSGVCG